MAKYVELCVPGQPASDCETKAPNCEMCILCQEDTDEKLINPCQSKKSTCESGFETLAQNLKEFHNLGEVPVDLDISALDEGSGIEETLRSNNAVWHKSCYLKCNNTKLERAKARKRKLENVSETESPVKTRSKITCSSDESERKSTCIFCEAYAIGIHD